MSQFPSGSWKVPDSFGGRRLDGRAPPRWEVRAAFLCSPREREQREREQRLDALHEGKEKARLQRERLQLERQRQRLERERLERERLERERERVERERRKEQERIQREREELRHQQEQLRYEQERRSVLRRPYDVGR